MAEDSPFFPQCRGCVEDGKSRIRHKTGQLPIIKLRQSNSLLALIVHYIYISQFKATNKFEFKFCTFVMNFDEVKYILAQ